MLHLIFFLYFFIYLFPSLALVGAEWEQGRDIPCPYPRDWHGAAFPTLLLARRWVLLFGVLELALTLTPSLPHHFSGQAPAPWCAHRHRRVAGAHQWDAGVSPSTGVQDAGPRGAGPNPWCWGAGCWSPPDTGAGCWSPHPVPVPWDAGPPRHWGVGSWSPPSAGVWDAGPPCPMLVPWDVSLPQVLGCRTLVPGMVVPHSTGVQDAGPPRLVLFP